MTLREAMAVISQTCANYRGTLQEHQQVQQALQVVDVKIKEKCDMDSGRKESSDSVS